MRFTFVVFLIVFFLSESANALNRKIFECSEPFDDTVCTFNRFSGYYNYWFGRTEVAVPAGSGARGPNPLDGSTDVDTLFELSGKADQYYRTKFGRNGLNGLGGTGDGSNVNFKTTDTVILANANTTSIAISHGVCDDGHGAYAISSPGYVAFCRGSANVNTVGHELNHILAHPFLDLTLEDTAWYEAGTVFESYADFFGEAFERYVTGSTDWLFTSGPSNVVLRSLSNPPSVPQDGFPSPDRYLSPDFYTGTADAGGTHINAGVLNKAAYLTVEGGTFNGFEITGIGFDKVEQIWYRALTMYMEPGQTFNQAYDDLVHAATDLYPEADVWELTKALRSVELNMPRTFYGDFNSDGNVDAADYVTWRKGLGTLYSQASVNRWRQNFGLTAGSSASIPEPSTFCLLAVGAVSLLGRRTR